MPRNGENSLPYGRRTIARPAQGGRSNDEYHQALLARICSADDAGLCDRLPDPVRLGTVSFILRFYHGFQRHVCGLFQLCEGLYRHQQRFSARPVVHSGVCRHFHRADQPVRSGHRPFAGARLQRHQHFPHGIFPAQHDRRHCPRLAVAGHPERCAGQLRPHAGI